MVKGRKGNKGKLRDEIVPFTSEEVGKLLDGAGSPMHRCLFGLAVGLGEGWRSLLSTVAYNLTHLSTALFSLQDFAPVKP